MDDLLMEDLAERLRTQIQGDKATAERCEVREFGIADRAITPHVGVIDKPGCREHIARHDPRDVIVRCDADLSLIDHCLRMIGASDKAGPGDQWSGGRRDAAEETLRLLAQGYQHRPGWRE